MDAGMTYGLHQRLAASGKRERGRSVRGGRCRLPRSLFLSECLCALRHQELLLRTTIL